MLVVQVVWNVAKNCPALTYFLLVPSQRVKRIEVCSKFSNYVYLDQIASLQHSDLGPDKKNYNLAILGQALKDMYNAYGPIKRKKYLILVGGM